jgi:hypothetical protein
MALNKLLRGATAKDNAIGLACALIPFLAYLLTLSPSIGPGDAGELAAASSTLGIAHPTGYPLFTLLGRAVSILPLGDLRVIVKLNLLAASLCATAVFLIYRLFLLILRTRLWTSEANARDPGDDASRPGAQRLAAVAGTFVFAFSHVFWINALTPEVYALHMVFTALVTLFFIRALEAHADGAAHAVRDWLLFAYFLGLSFTNHLMTVLLLPAFGYLYFTAHGGRRASWAKIARGLPVFILGLSAYLYLPVRAASRPELNWGNPTSVGNFLRHVSGEQYRTQMFGASGLAWVKFREFVGALPSDLGYLPLPLVAFGIWVAFRKRRRLFVFTLLVLGATLFYTFNYAFNDPNYYLHATLVFALWFGIGLHGLARSFPNNAHRILVIGLVCAVVPAITGLRSVTKRHDYAVEDFARNALASVTHGGVLLTDLHDEVYAPALYLQRVEGVRTDVIVIQAEALGFHWHTLELRSRYADFDTLFPSAATDDGDDAGAAFTLRGFQRMREFDALGTRRPLYWASRISEPGIGGLSAYPEGTIMRLSPVALAPTPFAGPRFRPLLPDHRPGDRPHVSNIRELYATQCVNHALYRTVMFRTDSAAARDLLRQALAVRPGFAPAAIALRKLERGE